MKSPRTAFPRYCRLTSKKQFNQVLRYRTRVAKFGCVRAYLLNSPTPPAGTARLGIIVAKKQFSTAVARNRIKRLIRNSFRLARAHLLNVDVVVQVFSGEKENQLILNMDALWQTLDKRSEPQRTDADKF